MTCSREILCFEFNVYMQYSLCWFLLIMFSIPESFHIDVSPANGVQHGRECQECQSHNQHWGESLHVLPVWYTAFLLHPQNMDVQLIVD